MSNQKDILFDKIETDIMSVLYANIDYIFTQYSLFNKLINDKYDFSATNLMHPDFKSKYLLVLRNLMSKYDDIKITKEKEFYYVVCLSSSDAPIKFNNITKDNKKSGFELTRNDISEMYDYIYKNSLNEYINWTDPFDGNTIFHELVLSNNINQITNLVEKNIFNYTVTNKFNQAPVDMIKTSQVANIMIMGLIKNLNQTKEKLNEKKENVNMLVKNINSKINWYESKEYKDKIITETGFVDIILMKTKKYCTLKTFMVSLTIYYLLNMYYS